MTPSTPLDEADLTSSITEDLCFLPPDREADQLTGLKILVVGLGTHGGGTDLVKFLTKRGAIVSITDTATAEVLGASLEQIEGLDLHSIRLAQPHCAEDLEGIDWVVINPAIPPQHSFLRDVARSGVRPVTELGLALSWLPASQVAAITGTHGKSTTCKLVQEMLSGSGVLAQAGGNLGGSLLRFLDDPQLHRMRFIVEVSSFQAQRLAVSGPLPRVVAITQLGDDHLDWHGSREAYHRAKKRLLNSDGCPDDVAILPTNGPLGRDFISSRSQVIRCGIDGQIGESRVEGEELCINAADGSEVRIPFQPSAALPGSTGAENSLRAATIAFALSASPEAIAAAIENYSGLPHRYQPLGVISGVQFIDDSKATTPEAVASALRSTAGVIHWLCGGKPKGDRIDGSSIGSAFAERDDIAAYCFGPHARQWKEALVRQIPTIQIDTFEDLAAASRAAFDRAEGHETILLSPGGTSFDLYRSAEERGIDFKRCFDRFFEETPTIS